MANSFENLYCSLVRALYDAPISNPRGMKVKEIIVPCLQLSNPRARLLNCPPRKANYGFAVGEFLWYLRGAEDLKSISYYNKRMVHYSNDGETINSAYGKRLLVDVAGKSNVDKLTQWQICVEELIRDNDSRRAVMFIGSPADHADAIISGSKDVPCTLSMQFLIRNKKLHLHVNMRSNDVIWGLTYDLFSFTLLQECMLLSLKEAGLDVELGSYIHTAGSMHVYEQHFGLMKEIKEWDYSIEYKVPQQMESIDSLSSLNRLLSDEAALRIKLISSINEENYIGACKWMAKQLNEHRRLRDEQETE